MAQGACFGLTWLIRNLLAFGHCIIQDTELGCPRCLFLHFCVRRKKQFATSGSFFLVGEKKRKWGKINWIVDFGKRLKPGKAILME